MSPQTILSISGLGKTYASGLRALDDVNLDIQQGEIFALLGPNGAGKTTTVEILEGYRKRTSGEVSVLGHDPHHGADVGLAVHGMPGSGVVHLAIASDDGALGSTLKVPADRERTRQFSTITVLDVLRRVLTQT